MTSLSSGLRGAQRPRVSSVPPYVATSGVEAIELARVAGLDLDPWQEYVVTEALGEREDGRWSAFEVGVEVSRQNGKGAILEARELAGLFLLGENLIVHSAHEFATAEEALERMAAIIEGCEDLSHRVRTIKRSHGQEGVYLKSGARLLYKTRTKGGGRGLSADCVILDESMILPETAIGALMPVVSARPNPQIWYTGSAVDQKIHEHGLVFARLRERGLKGGDPSLAYFGWGPDVDRPSAVTPEMAVNPDMWAQTNPGLGIRITVEHVAREQRSMDPRTFAVERLGVGDWPSAEQTRQSVIAPEKWAACKDSLSASVGAVSFALAVPLDRGSAVIGVAGVREDGLHHIEVVERRDGTGWVAARLAELVARHDAGPVILDERGPAASLLTDLDHAGVAVEPVAAKEWTRACAALFDSVAQGRLRHRDESRLNAAVSGAQKRAIGDSWAWDRKAAVDCSPLEAVTLALWGLDGAPLEPLSGWG